MFSPHHVTKGTALALALGAIVAPVASATTVTYSRQDKQQVTNAGAGPASARPYVTRPYDLNANGSYVPRAPGAPVGAAQSFSNGPGSTGVQGAPPILPAPTPSQGAAIQRAGQQTAQVPGARYSSAEMNAYPSGSDAAGAVASDGGFDWGDAGIGAAGGLVITMLGVGGGLALSQRRSRRTSPSAVVTA